MSSPESTKRPGIFIAVEGIDGSGKSTLADELAGLLGLDSEPAVLVTRRTASSCAAGRGYAASHLAGLQRLIWQYPEQASTSELGFWHWCHLLAAWFHAVGEVVVGPALAANRCVVADSWYYKYAARFSLTIGLERALTMFGGIPEPDRVLWLDVAPEICLKRRHDLRATEQGEWLGLTGRETGFVRYQQQVRSAYAAMSAARDWEPVGETDLNRLRHYLEDFASGLTDAPRNVDAPLDW